MEIAAFYVSRKSLLCMKACRPVSTEGPSEVVSYVTEGLVRRGHEVTLFAAGDSVTRANLVPGCDRALRLEGKAELALPMQLAMLSRVFEAACDSFDIVHSHIEYWSFPFARLTKVPTVSTMHGRLDIPELKPIYHRFPEAALVSISDSQRAPLAEMNWVGTVHHGMPRNLLRTDTLFGFHD